MEEKPKESIDAAHVAGVRGEARCGKNVRESDAYRDMFISKPGLQRIQNQKRRKLER